VANDNISFEAKLDISYGTSLYFTEIENHSLEIPNTKTSEYRYVGYNAKTYHLEIARNDKSNLNAQEAELQSENVKGMPRKKLKKGERLDSIYNEVSLTKTVDNDNTIDNAMKTKKKNLQKK